MQDNYQLLIQKLDAFIRKYYKNQFVKGAIYAFTLSLAFYLLVTTLEYVGHFSTTLPVSYTHLRAHETVLDLVCRLLLEKKKNNKHISIIKLLLYI